MNRSKNLVRGVISTDAFVQVNKKISRRIGFIEAGILGELIATHRWAEQENRFFENGEKGEWFYLTQPTIEQRFGIKRREHDTAIKNLVKFKVIEKKRLGVPAKSFYMLIWENIEEILYKSDDEPLIQSDCTKRTNKDVQNVQTRVDETYKLDVTKRIPIKKNYKNNIIKTNNKNLDDDEKEPFEINNLAFKEFVKEFQENFPNLFDNQKFQDIYEQMILQELAVITFQEGANQARYMEKRQSEGKLNLGDYAAYFIGGIKKKRTSQQNALEKRILAKAEKELKEKKEREEKERQTKIPPVYNWLEN